MTKTKLTVLENIFLGDGKLDDLAEVANTYYAGFEKRSKNNIAEDRPLAAAAEVRPTEKKRKETVLSRPPKKRMILNGLLRNTQAQEYLIDLLRGDSLGDEKNLEEKLDELTKKQDPEKNYDTKMAAETRANVTFESEHGEGLSKAEKNTTILIVVLRTLLGDAKDSEDEERSSYNIPREEGSRLRRTLQPHLETSPRPCQDAQQGRHQGKARHRRVLG